MTLQSYQDQKLEVENKINEEMNRFVKSIFAVKGFDNLPSKVEFFTGVEHESDGTSYRYFSGVEIEGKSDCSMCDVIKEHVDYNYTISDIEAFSWNPEAK